MLDEALKLLLEQTLRETVPGLVQQGVRDALASAAPKPTDDGYLTTAEAATWIRVNPATIRQWIGKGHLTRLYAGRELRISKTELRDFLGCQTHEPESLDADEIANEIVKSL